MKVWILRHGEAEGHARTDAERNLTEHGRAEVLRSAAQLMGQPLSAIIASPYVRAQQTAELVREVLGFEPEVRTVPWLTPRATRCRCWTSSTPMTTCCWSATSRWWAT